MRVTPPAGLRACHSTDRRPATAADRAQVHGRHLPRLVRAQQHAAARHSLALHKSQSAPAALQLVNKDECCMCLYPLC